MTEPEVVAWMAAASREEAQAVRAARRRAVADWQAHCTDPRQLVTIQTAGNAAAELEIIHQTWRRTANQGAAD
jgi:hypothetical protein